MILAYVICARYCDTFESGCPFDPIHGKSVTAAEMIFEEPIIGLVSTTTGWNRRLLPRADRRDCRNDRKLAASDDE